MTRRIIVAYDFCRQLVGEGLNPFTNEEIELRKAEAIDGVGSLIGIPHDGSVPLKEKLKGVLKPNERRKLTKQVKKEETRYKAHEDLYNYLINDTIEQFHASAFLIEPQVRKNWIEGVLGLQYPVVGDMNNWNERDIIGAKKLFEKYKKIAESREDEGMSSAQNTAINPLRVAASLDPSGYALKAVEESVTVFDTIKNKTHKLRSKIDSQNNQIARVVQDDRLTEAHELLRDLLDGRARSMYPMQIPNNPKNFNVWRNSAIGKYFYYALKHAHLQQNIETQDGDARYIMIKKSNISNMTQSPEEADALIDVFERQIEKVHGINVKADEEFYIAYRVPSNIDAFIKGTKSPKTIAEVTNEKGLIDVLEKNELEQGVYEATAFDTYGSDMPNRGIQYGKARKRKGYQNYERKDKQPPATWMDTLWRVRAEQQEMYSDMFDEFKMEITSYNHEVNAFRAPVKKVLEMWGMGDVLTQEQKQEGQSDPVREEFLQRIEHMGDFSSNLVYDSENDVLLSPNTFVRQIREGYDYNQWHIGDYWDMLQDAILDIDEKISTENRDIERYSQVIQNQESNEADIEEASNVISRASERIHEMTEMSEIINDMLHTSSGDVSGDAQKDMVMNGKMLMFKSRGLLTDPMRRRRDPELMKDYIDSGYRTIEMNKIKLSLMKSMLFMPNKQLAEYVVDQVLASTGSHQVQAGLFKLGYSNEAVSKIVSAMMPWKNDKIESHDIARAGAMHNGFVVYANLGAGTALTNNMQRATPILDYGWPLFARSYQALHNGDTRYTSEEWMDIVRETGVLDPVQAFTDALLAGASGANGMDWLMPLVDMAKVKLGSKGFAQKWTIDSLLANSTGRNEADIRALKERIHQIATSNSTNKKLLIKQIRQLNLGLSERYMGKLVAWKLGWFPSKKLAGAFTMTESEQMMRAEVALMGMFQAEQLGELGDVESQFDKNPEAKPWLSEAGIKMARLMVYNTMFGMSQQFLPKMFRGAVGKFFMQFKSYQYHQMEHDMKYVTNFWRSNKGQNLFTGVTEAPVRLVAEMARMIGRVPGRLGSMASPVKNYSKMKDMDDSIDDRSANRLLKFLLVRGGASMLSAVMFYHSAFTGVLRLALRGVGRNPLARRGLFGLETPVVTYPLHILWALYAAGSVAGRDDDDDNLQDFLRDWLPPAITSLQYLFQGEYRQFLRAYTPEPLRSTGEFIEETDMMDDMGKYLKRF